MDLDNPVIKLCVEGSRAEFEGKPEDARALYARAWQIARDDYEACIAAHYVARFQNSPEDNYKWNLEALQRAEAVQDGRAQEFLPSLYLNLGRSYEVLGNAPEAQNYYALAASLGYPHQAGSI